SVEHGAWREQAGARGGRALGLGLVGDVDHGEAAVLVEVAGTLAHGAYPPFTDMVTRNVAAGRTSAGSTDVGVSLATAPRRRPVRVERSFDATSRDGSVAGCYHGLQEVP